MSRSPIMGRRSSHSPEELRDLILDSATGLIEKGGMSGLSAREIARQIGYSPGTLYNVFSDLDDLVLTIEHRILDRLFERLSSIPVNPDPIEHLCELAAAYLAFTQESPRLWNLLVEHHMPREWKAPPAFCTRMEALLVCVEHALAPLIPQEQTGQTQRAALALWSGVHGISLLATADKLTHITPEVAAGIMDDLVRYFLAGFVAAQAKGRHS